MQTDANNTTISSKTYYKIKTMQAYRKTQKHSTTYTYNCQNSENNFPSYVLLYSWHL